MRTGLYCFLIFDLPQLTEGSWMPTDYKPGVPSFPAIYRQHIFFMSSADARNQFILNPLAFLCQPSPKPFVPIRIAIVGPPKSGKSTCKSFFCSCLTSPWVRQETSRKIVDELLEVKQRNAVCAMLFCGRLHFGLEADPCSFRYPAFAVRMIILKGYLPLFSDYVIKVRVQFYVTNTKRNPWFQFPLRYLIALNCKAKINLLTISRRKWCCIRSDYWMLQMV